MKVIDSIDLYFQEGGSDKEYHLQLVDLSGTYAVDFQYGRRGSTLSTGRKIETPGLDQAKKAYEKVKLEKMSKGYHEEDAGNKAYSPAAVGDTPKQALVLPQLLNPIEDDKVEEYLEDAAFGAQEKKDGRHQIIRVVDGAMTVFNRKGKEIGYPSAWSGSIDVKNIILDGEAIGEQFHAFDLLEVGGEDFRSRGYSERHVRLVRLFKEGGLSGSVKLVPLACTSSEKKTLYAQLQKDKKEGIVFKKLSASYKPGRPSELGDMLKRKFYATLTARVRQGRLGKHSIGLELLDGKVWVDVGNVTIAQKTPLPASGTCVEIRYLYGYEGGSLYQPTYLGPRDDLDDSDCVISQVKYKADEE